ncbi:BamA/TamA family outer membrane protein [Vibrio astriarenae]|uniref:BamA/TamA family outer membrane protein n=1 Tax=Vibrio astriarenae TaxID=1481923 RepID=UPI003734F713
MVVFTSVLLSAVLFSTMVFSQENETTEVTSSKESKFTVFPIPFYDPSIKSGVSLVPMYSFYASDQQDSPSTISATFTYTQTGSYNIRGNTDILLDKFRFVSDFGFNYSDLDVQFFKKARHKAQTIQEEFNFFGEMYYGLTDSVFLGVGLSYQTERYSGKTKRDHLQLIAARRCLSYCSDTGASVSLLIDKRDHYYYPHSGYMLSLTYDGHPEWLGNDANATYSVAESDFRYFHSLNDAQTKSIATRWLNRYLLDSENAPSSALSLFGRQGRDVQRGFIVGDYIPSANITSLEFEYRHEIEGSGSELLDKMTVVGLAGAGKYYGRLANPLQEEDTIRDADTLSMVGFGLRYAILPKERINIRMDVTYNNSEQWLVYFGFGENI